MIFPNKFNKFSNTRASVAKFYLSFATKIAFKSQFGHPNVSFTIRIFGCQRITKRIQIICIFNPLVDFGF